MQAFAGDDQHAGQVALAVVGGAAVVASGDSVVVHANPEVADLMRGAELPAVDEAPEHVSRDPAERPSSTAALGARHKVVLVEDNPANVAFIEAVVEDLDEVDLVTAPNAELGLELIRAHRPTVVITDIHLPGMSGFEAVRRLQASPDTQHIPVVGLSAAAFLSDEQDALRAGFTRYLTKPVQLEDLLATVSGMTAGGRG